MPGGSVRGSPPPRQNNDSMLVHDPFLVKGVYSYNGQLRAAFLFQMISIPFQLDKQLC